jgi:hypothetical protein
VVRHFHDHPPLHHDLPRLLWPSLSLAGFRPALAARQGAHCPFPRLRPVFLAVIALWLIATTAAAIVRRAVGIAGPALATPEGGAPSYRR